MPYANNKGAAQYPRSLISTFVVRCLHRIIPILAKSEISRAVAEQAGLSLTSSDITKDRFSHDEAHIGIQHDFLCNDFC